MFEGTLIMESLAIGAALEVPMLRQKINRVQVTGATAKQPSTLTLMDFQVSEDAAEALASSLARTLDQPGCSAGGDPKWPSGS